MTANYVKTIDGQLYPLGYVQYTALAAAETIVFPPDCCFAFIVCEAEGVRWRDDGIAPTATVGMPLQVGAYLEYNGVPTPSAGLSLQFIAQTAGAILNISFYGVMA